MHDHFKGAAFSQALQHAGSLLVVVCLYEAQLIPLFGPGTTQGGAPTASVRLHHMRIKVRPSVFCSRHNGRGTVSLPVVGEVMQGLITTVLGQKGSVCEQGFING